MSKVVHIALGHSPTDDRIFYKEARSLAKRGYRVTIVAPDREEVNEKDGVRFALFKEKGYWHNLLTAYRIALKLKADIYHLHEFELLPFGLWLKYKYRRKVIYDAHESVFWFFMDFSRRNFFIRFLSGFFSQSLEYLCMRAADHIITVTPWVEAHLRPFHPKRSIVYNYPIVDFFPVDRKETKKLVILYHGQIVPGRNIELMINAMKIVRKTISEAHLLFVGSGTQWYRLTLERMISESGLEKSVEIQPPIPYAEIPALISQVVIGFASMQLNESYQRSIQVKPFEFMAMGIPVLGVNVPSIAKYVVESGAGLIVDPLTPENLADRILYLLKNPDVRKIMGEHGRQAVRKKYNWDKTLPTLLKVYQELSEC